MTRARPTLPLFIAAACGALIGLVGAPPWWPLALLSVLFAVGACFALDKVKRALLLVAMSASIAATVGALEVNRRPQAALDDVVVVEGTVDDAVATQTGWRATVDVTGILDPAPRALKMRVDVWSPELRVTPGDRVRVRGVLRPPEPADSPGVLDGERHALAHGIDARITASAPTDLVVMERAESFRPFARARIALRDRLTSLLTPREAGLVLALIVGDTSLIDDEQRDLYRAVGAGHLLAVSGLQISLIALLLRRALISLLLLTPPGRRARGRAFASLLTLAGVWSFVLVCGAPASAVRAGAMASALLAAELLGRRANALDALGIAGMLTVLVSPQSVFDASFLLSYAAVIGLAVAMRPRDDDETTSVLTRLRDGALACIGAGLVTLPVSAYLFGQVSMGGLLANVVVVPAAVILQIPAIAFGLLGALTNVALIAKLGAQAALLLESLVAGLAEILPGTTLVDTPGGIAIIALTACAVAVSAAIARMRPALAAVAVVVAMAVIVVTRLEPGGVRIAVLPVGQGDGAVLELPNGQVIVVDGGGNVLGSRDPGAEVMVPFLKRRGIDAIDVMILSHPHPDHGKGLVSIANALPIKEIWHPGAAADDPILSPLISAAAGARIRSTPELLGAHAFGEVRLEVLAPAPKEKTPNYPELGANDNSLVIRVCVKETCALWAGDVEELGEELLLASGVDIKAQLVKAPHHGSSTSSTEEFVKRTGADHVIMCTGRGNTFGFPHSVVVERWRAAGAKIWDTARHGEVTAWLSDAGIRISTFRD